MKIILLKLLHTVMFIFYFGGGGDLLSYDPTKKATGKKNGF